MKTTSLASLLITTFLSVNLYANLPTGSFKIEKIQCKTGHIMDVGGKFMVYDILLDITDKNIKMTATVEGGDWMPGTLNCEQINYGRYTNTRENQYEGDLPNIKTKCNNAAWTAMLKRWLFGVEEYGTFTYKVNGKRLVIYNKDTITKYSSCDKPGDYPIYHYIRR